MAKHKVNPNNEKTWYDKGIRFECQGSGRCCVSRGEYGFVYMNTTDRKRMAKVLGMSLTEFTKQHCSKTDGHYHLTETPGQMNCRFLEGNKCSVYEGRPEQCRTWPFWPENLDAKVWKKDVAAFCPGVNKGKLYSKKEIESIAGSQLESELAQ